MTAKQPQKIERFDPAWYCIHTKKKSEHAAAIHLAQLDPELEVFNPRIRFQKKTTRGPVWFTESLFPGYVFGRFVLADWLRAVNHTPAVLRIINFGGYYPHIPGEVIETWRQRGLDGEPITIHEELQPGDAVEILDGPFREGQSVILKVIPAKQRVLILLEMLGSEHPVELSTSQIRKLHSDIRCEAASQLATQP